MHFYQSFIRLVQLGKNTMSVVKTGQDPRLTYYQSRQQVEILR